MPLFGPPDVGKLEAKNDVAGLIKALEFPKDPHLRWAAAEALGRCGDARGFDPLMAALKDWDPEVRMAAADALGIIGDPRAGELLVATLKDKDAAVRCACVSALGRLGDASALEPMVAALEDGQGVVREASARALGSLGESAIVPLLTALRGPDSPLREAAAEALVRIGPPAIAPLVTAMAEPELRGVVSVMLGQIGGSGAIEPLIAGMTAGDDLARAAAADTLDLLAWSPDEGEAGAAYWAVKGEWEKCVEIGGPAVAALGDALDSPDPEARRSAADALGRIADARAVSRLLGSVADPSPAVRAAAVASLGEIRDPAAVDGIIAALKDSDSTVRQAAARALGKIGDARAVEPLIEALKDLRVTVVAADALVSIGAPSAGPLVATLGDHAAPNPAAEALIVQIGSPAVEPLIALLLDDREPVRLAAIDSLKRLSWIPDAGEAGAAYWVAVSEWDKCVELGACAVAPLLNALANWRTPDDRWAAIGALGRIGDARAVEGLCAALADKDKDLHEPAALALGEIGDARAVKPLIAAMKDRNPKVRKVAVGVLAGFDDPRAVRAVKSALRNSAPTGAASPVSVHAPAAPAPASPAPAPTPAPAVTPPVAVPVAASVTASDPPAWIATHLVPPLGMAAWDVPDPARPAVWHLPGRLELLVEASAGAWARVRAVNGWWGWVDGRLLVERR